MRRLIVLSVFVLSMIVQVVQASADEAWDGFLAQSGVYDDIANLAQSFSEALSSEDSQELVRLADTVRDDTHPRFRPLLEAGFAMDPTTHEIDQADIVAERMVESNLFSDEGAALIAVEGLKSCSTAGILLKHLIIAVARDKLTHRVADGRLVVDGTSADRAFALHFARCQLLERKTWTPSVIGYHPQACRPDREVCPEIDP